MKTKYPLFAVLGLGILFTVGTLIPIQSIVPKHVLAQDQTTAEILKHISQLTEKTGSYHAEIITTTKSKGEKKVIKGKVRFKWPNMRWQENRHSTKHGFELAYIISNGIIRWNYIPSLNLAMKYDNKALDEDAQQKGWLSAGYFKKGSLRYLGKERLGSDEMYVFEGEQSALKRQKNAQPETARVYFNAHGILQKMVVFDYKGGELSTQTFSNIQLDASLTVKEFEFIPPEGTQIQEIKDVGSRTNPES